MQELIGILSNKEVNIKIYIYSYAGEIKISFNEDNYCHTLEEIRKSSGEIEDIIKGHIENFLTSYYREKNLKMIFKDDQK